MQVWPAAFRRGTFCSTGCGVPVTVCLKFALFAASGLWGSSSLHGGAARGAGARLFVSWLCLFGRVRDLLSSLS